MPVEEQLKWYEDPNFWDELFDELVNWKPSEEEPNDAGNSVE